MTNTNSRGEATTRRGSRWAMVPVALLLSSFFGVGGMALIAMRDPNFALEPDYYQKALHWDVTQAQAVDNQRLGYRFSAPSVIALDKSGRASLRLTIKDRDGRPVSGASVRADAFANAYSEAILRLTFRETAPGVYLAEVKALRTGLWEFRVQALTGVAHATAIVRCDLTRGAA